MEELESRLIYTFPRGLGEEIQIALRKYHGKHYIDIRVWFQEKKSKEFRPTRKGISFPALQTTELKRGVDRFLKATETMDFSSEARVVAPSSRTHQNSPY